VPIQTKPVGGNRSSFYGEGESTQSMYSLIVLAVVSFALALVATPVLRDLFARWGVVDMPDGIRKIHAKPVPRMGGVPILVSCFGAYGVLMLTPMWGGHAVLAALPSVWRLLPAVGVVFVVGIVDDVCGLKPWQKLLGEAMACGLAISGGVHITGVVGVHFPPALALVGTVVWLTGCANAVNLIDGMDGLAAGIALLAAVTMFAAAMVQGNMALAFATAPLAGALLGFLRYNFNGASIFLGDSGSLTLGFLLGCYGILWSQKAATIAGMTAPLLTLAVPLADAALAIVRRFLRQQPIFTADMGHIHHRLLAQGLNPRRVVLLLYAVAGVCAWLSLAITLLHENFTKPILLMFVIGTLLAISFLRYAEFGTARRLVLEGAFRRLLNARISLDAVEERLQAASSLDQCWQQLAGAYQSFGFTSLELRVGGRTFRDPAASSTPHAGWQVRVELENGNQVLLRRDAGVNNQVTLAAGFVELIEKTLTVKLPEFGKQYQASQPKESSQTAAA
jgi:UDP-GlcNAc:undecaprenyl-phosphate/decaprenyl-phosphate GlcNAc-1-phosphate transferase